MESVDSATSENDYSGEADDVTVEFDSSSTPYGKSRKPNWTSHEIRALVEGYSRNRDTMKSRGVYRSTGERAVGNAQRQAVWEAITKDVNKSRPDFPRSGPFGYSCMRTVKEVVKKWVNLINRMKSELAIKKSNPRFELGSISHAVYTIMHTSDPIEFRDHGASVLDGEASAVVKLESEWEMDSNNSNSMEVFDNENDQHEYEQIQKRYRPILPAPDKNSQVPSNLRTAILKRRSQQNGTQSEGYSASSFRNSDGLSSAKRPSLEASVDDGYSYLTDTQNLSNLEQDVDELRESYKLNKEILELQKRKLELEIERTVVEKEKMEIEKEKSLLEKETKNLEKDITQLRKEMMELKVKKMKQMLNIKPVESAKSKEEESKDEIKDDDMFKETEDDSDVQ